MQACWSLSLWCCRLTWQCASPWQLWCTCTRLLPEHIIYLHVTLVCSALPHPDNQESVPNCNWLDTAKQSCLFVETEKFLRRIFVACCNAVHTHNRCLLHLHITPARSCMQQKLMLAVCIACAVKCACTHIRLDLLFNISKGWGRAVVQINAYIAIANDLYGDAALWQ